MERISLFSDLDNLAEIFAMDRETELFQGIKRFLSKESEITICETEEVAEQNLLFQSLALELTSGDFLFHYRKAEDTFLEPKFKTNLHEHFNDKSSILFSYDNARVQLAKPKTGILLAGVGEEVETYNKLNFKKEFFRASKVLTIGNSFNKYDDLAPYILPFFEVIINEPYLFKPDRNDWNVQNYLNNNFIPLMNTLLAKTQNKVNIIINTFVTEDEDRINEFPYYDAQLEKVSNNGFKPLYDMCSDYLNNKLGANRYKLWIIVSPQTRKARHDRYILTNYQFIDSPSGLAYFDDRGNFSSRGEAIHLYTIMHDETRKELVPSVLDNTQKIVVDGVKMTHPTRILGIENGDSYFLKFT
ncbi:hypothetical protein [Marinifilum fragile]|uniref:hypothetical protein n=1 Tax=Marinifilum fragile TaxID=570161 RepID=UPI002AA69175|nr:hypothetical protein [Marinifilum fragile]